MASVQASKSPLDKTEKNESGAVSEKPVLTSGTAIYQSPTAAERALAELVLVRCGDSRLVGSQVIEEAKACGQAVKAAFKELHAADVGE